MNAQAFTTLEFQQLRELVKQGAQTEPGRSRIAQIEPLENLPELQRELAALGECIGLRNRGVAWSFSDLLDPQESIGLLRVEGSALDANAILQLARLSEQALSARASILAERDSAPTLWQLVENLPRDLNSLVARVATKILPSGELDDRASPELGRIRHAITVLRSRITRTLEGLMRKSEEAIQDELVTIRNDRFVIPVKADHRGRVKGVAHGYSSSGATAFIEPLETIDANNELQSLHEEEARETARILFALSEELRTQLPAIELAATAVTELDVINGKAIFHRRFNCVVPRVHNEAKLELINARHPLLEENLKQDGKVVVPVSFTLDEAHDTMVISGANAGGKTVVLKTTGLLALMAVSGLSVPAFKAEFPFYQSILADIGDHQSIAANLSTFTSHVANIARMIQLCEAPALVLLDEVGTGTDPEEGSALGVAVVDYFRRMCPAHVIATTHYSGLKMYAGLEEGVLNASVEFDEKTLQPTYRLILGVAGSSSGLEIARRFGVPETITKAAVTSVKDSSRQASEYLSRIKREAEEAERLRIALEEEREAVAEKFASLDKEAANREQRRQSDFERILQRQVSDFEKKARELVAHISDRADRLKVEKEAQRQTAELKREAQRAARAAKPTESRQVEEDSRSIRIVRDGQVVLRSSTPTDDSELAEPGYVAAEQRKLVVGDKVRMRSFGSVGVIEQIKGGEAEVRVKALRFKEKLQNLELVEAQPSAKPQEGKLEKLRRTSGTEVHLKEAEQSATSEINVIGKTTDEAVEIVDKFLDEASLASMSEVRIVHGHGTGALRRAIGDLLKDHPHVGRFIPAPQDQGGSGATIVHLRGS
ncbi:MAG TPA: Smr/MutS family protein [Pyrinomonadaceae bacterium]|nr:Smr/MutS family protein [Pyrinomonadaceae bacterium]